MDTSTIPAFFFIPDPPQWVLGEIAKRTKAAEEAYQSVKTACEHFGMKREQYIAAFIENNFPPIIYTTSSTAGSQEVSF